MSKPTFDINKLRTSSLWIKLYRSDDPAEDVNIEQWDIWKNIIASNPVLSKLPIKLIAKVISMPWPDDRAGETLADYSSFVSVSRLTPNTQKTIILSYATAVIGYAGNKPGNYLDADSNDIHTFLSIYSDMPVSRLLTKNSWKSWQDSLSTSKLSGMTISEIAPYIGITVTTEIKKLKISDLTKMNLLELKGKYSKNALDIITICLATLSVSIKLNNKFDTGTSTGSNDLATIVLENYDTLKAMFAK